MRQLAVLHHTYPLKRPFVIARGTKTHADVVVVKLSKNGHVGYGECVPTLRYGETVESVMQQIEKLRPQIEGGLNCETLEEIMPAGAARNAIDSAILDLSLQENNKTWKDYFALEKVSPVLSAFTLSIDTPENMYAVATPLPYHLIKIKCAGDGQDAARIHAVRAAKPSSKIIIDANESCPPDQFNALLEVCATVSVSMLEQPFPEHKDSHLKNIPRKLPICADESCHTIQDLEYLKDKYDMINIKLDKCGGLTHGVKMAKKAKEMGFQVMLGCMVATSLSMRPAFYFAQQMDLVDIDGPLLLQTDSPYCKPIQEIRMNGVPYLTY